MNSTQRDFSTRTIFLSHGGGPLPLLDPVGHKDMIEGLISLVERQPKPSAIIIISAHWEAENHRITSHAKPALLYDYNGFPNAAYQIDYPAPGYPDLASQLNKHLRQSGIASSLDSNRGYDHGMFVPLKILYPSADIPCVQISLTSSLSAKQHIELGKALANLPMKNLLIIGSGFSFHNMQAFGGTQSDLKNHAFHAWLLDLCTAKDLQEHERETMLLEWESAPHARFCHPREEHLLPLHVCYGAAGGRADAAIEFNLYGKKALAFSWDAKM